MRQSKVGNAETEKTAVDRGSAAVQQFSLRRVHRVRTAIAADARGGSWRSRELIDLVFRLVGLVDGNRSDSDRGGTNTDRKHIEDSHST